MSENIQIDTIENLQELIEYSKIIQELLEYSSLQKIQNSYQTLKDQQVEFLGAKLNNQPVGFAQYCISTNLENYKHLRLDEIAVSKDFQQKGIGKLLLTFIEKTAIDKDCQVIFLATGIKNNIAQKFYFQNGFTISSLYMYKKLA